MTCYRQVYRSVGGWNAKWVGGEDERAVWYGVYCGCTPAQEGLTRIPHRGPHKCTRDGVRQQIRSVIICRLNITEGQTNIDVNEVSSLFKVKRTSCDSSELFFQGQRNLYCRDITHKTE